MAVDWIVPPSGTDAFGGVVVRATDVNDHILVCYYGGHFAAYRVQAGAQTAIGNLVSVTASPGTTHRLTVTAIGSSITAAWDGSTMLTASESFGKPRRAMASSGAVG